MMNICEYWDVMITTATMEELDDIFEHEHEIYELSQDDFDAFCEWADREDIDLTLCDERGLSYLISWSWDECGE